MVQFVLIRPGATDFDEQGRIQGTLDIPLNDQGVRDALRIVEEIRSLKIEAVYCSPCQSACQTAAAICDALNLKLKKLDTLRNIDHGLWQGMLIDDVKRKQPKVYRQWQEQPEIICPPEGEMLSAAQDRVEAVLAKSLKKHKEGLVALVVPEPLASLIHGQLSRSDVGGLWKDGSCCGKWEVISPDAASLAPTQP